MSDHPPPTYVELTPNTPDVARSGFTDPSAPSKRYKICFITSCMFTPGEEKGRGNLAGRRPAFAEKFGGYDFFLFTNREDFSHTSGWDSIYIPNEYLDKACNISADDPIRKDVYRSRYPKFQGYKYLKYEMQKEYDVIFYCDITRARCRPDPNIPSPRKDWQDFAHQISQHGLMQRKHPHYNGAFRECNVIERGGTDSKENMDKMRSFLKENDCPHRSLLTANGFFGYNPHNKQITDAFDYFFSIYTTEKLTHRDQPLWCYVRWKLGINPILEELYEKGKDIADTLEKRGKVKENRTARKKEMIDMNILEEMFEKIDKSDTGFTLHYPFLFSLVLGLESKEVFEFGTGFSTHCILHALEKTDGNLTSCDVLHYNKNRNVTDFTKQSKRWTFHHGNTNHTFGSIQHKQYDLILHDGAHRESEVLIDLNNIYPYLKHDGILITHDTRHHNLGAAMIKAVNDFARDKDVEMLTLPYGYGLTCFRNNGNSVNKVNLTWKKLK